MWVNMQVSGMLITMLSLLSAIGATVAILVMVKNAAKSKSRFKFLCGILMVSLSIVCGIIFGVYGVYSPDPSVTVHGIPIPTVIIENKKGQMIDYVHPRPIMYISMSANALIPAGIMSAIWVLVCQCAVHITRRRRHI